VTVTPTAAGPASADVRIPDTPRTGTPSAALLAAEQAADVLAGRRLVVLTGAGLSTDSGIPDYRGPDSPPRSPMTYDEFVSGPRARQRYWARSHIGWQRLGSAQPNQGHHALAALESAGVVRTLITQNVDGLHRAAGSRTVIDLHGRIDQVICLRCGDLSGRLELHHRLEEVNPEFVLVDCRVCGGVLKPDVVFFGENVPKARVDQVYTAMTTGQALLVAGSSLTVMSGLRFVRHAAKLGWPIVIVNRGITRGDPLARGRVDAGCTPTLTALAERLTG
jgi:NAD-dependent SIR2 family protein deacetylase